MILLEFTTFYQLVSKSTFPNLMHALMVKTEPFQSKVLHIGIEIYAKESSRPPYDHTSSILPSHQVKEEYNYGSRPIKKY